MTPALYLRHTLRESRGGLARLSFFIACLAIGVAAVVAVAGFSNSFESGFRSNAKELLGADLVVRNEQPLPDELFAKLAEIEGAEWMVTRDQPQVVQAGQGEDTRSQLCELLVVQPGYPYYGSLELQPPARVEEALDEDTVVVGIDLLDVLDIQPGDRIQVGDASFTVAAAAHNEPDRITGFMYIGPRVYLSEAAFARSGLADVGTRVRYKALVKLPDMPREALTAIDGDLENAMAKIAPVRIENFTEGRPSLQRGLDQLARFLGLIALLSLLLGGVGVAQAVRAWIAGRMDTIAVLKCIGMRPREILMLYASQAALLGIVGSVVGAALGVAFMAIVPQLFSAYVPTELINPFQPAAILRGMGLGVAVALVFSLPALVAVLRVPPVRVFRRDAEPLREARWVPFATILAIVGGIGVLAALQARSALIGAVFTGGVIITLLMLMLGAWIVMRIAKAIPRSLAPGVSLRHGLAALARPGANTMPSVVALGLGLLVLTCAGIVQAHLNDQLTGALPERAPSALLANIRSDQEAGVREMLAEFGAEEVVIAPLIITRFASIDGVPVEDLLRDGEDRRFDRRRVLREQWITYLDEPPASSLIVDGRWFRDDDVAEISLYKGWAERRDLDLGSTLSFVTSGGEREFTVTSLRELEFEEIGLNFEIITEPGYLDDVFQLRLATLHLPDGNATSLQNRIVAAYPNITFIGLGDIVDRVTSQIGRIGWGIRMLGLFIVGAAIAVLAGTVGIDSSRRGREVALLKTIGMTRRQVAGLFAVEYALIGLVAAVIGVFGGAIVSGLLITRAFETEYRWPFGFIALAMAAGVAVSVFAGFVASGGALQRKPIDVLRHPE